MEKLGYYYRNLIPHGEVADGSRWVPYFCFSVLWNETPSPRFSGFVWPSRFCLTLAVKNRFVPHWVHSQHESHPCYVKGQHSIHFNIFSCSWWSWVTPFLKDFAMLCRLVHVEFDSTDSKRQRHHDMIPLLFFIFFFHIPLFVKVIGGELQERLIPVPYSKNTTDQAVSSSSFCLFLNQKDASAWSMWWTSCMSMC